MMRKRIGDEKREAMKDIYNRRNTTNGEYKCIQCIRREDRAYPEKLKNHRGMPAALYVIGRLPQEERPSVAIVGARRSTLYGNETARMFARSLAQAGVQIISGMAWGIDGCAHRGALEAGGDTFAVLGSGADVCYPSGQRKIYEELKRKGGILSEQPPGMPPLPGNFPARNRIISGLSDLVLVVEAGERSGALITADFALEQGKDVFTVPGRIGDEQSRGCLGLLRQGAGLADSPDTLLEALHLPKPPSHSDGCGKKIMLANEEDIMYSLIRSQPTPLEELLGKTGYPIQKALSVLVELELMGCIKEVHKNQYIRTDLRTIDGEIFGDSGVTCKGEDNQEVFGPQL